MDKQNIKNTKLKGTVLFTVVSVMMVLIVFVMATLTIASAASKRSYNTYFKNQSLYSARSVVDTTVEELSKSGTENKLKDEADKLSKGGTLELSCDLPAGMGRVTELKIENVGKDEIGSDNFVAGSGSDIIKVSATVEMGSQSQASTYSKFIVKSLIVNEKDSTDGGLVTTGSGLSGSDNSVSIFGSTYSFNDKIDTNDINQVKGSWSMLKNEGLVNSLSYNSSLHINTALKGAFGKKEGLYVEGHLVLDNQPVFRSKVGKADDLMYSDIPYIYVGGVFYKNSTSEITIGELNEHNKSEKPINIYCGSLNGTHGMQNIKVGGDIYAYDEYTNDSNKEDVKGNESITGLTVFGGDSAKTSLLNWVTGLVTSTDTDFANHTGGSFYSNGKLLIKGNREKEFNGDVIVKGPVEINASSGGNAKIIIGGSLYAGESLKITGNNGTNEFTVGGGIFVGAGITAATVSIDEGVTINGVKCGTDAQAFITAVNAAATKAKVDATQEKIAANPTTIFPKTMDKEYLLAEVIEDNNKILKRFKNEDGEYKDYRSTPGDGEVCYSTVYRNPSKQDLIDNKLPESAEDYIMYNTATGDKKFMQNNSANPIKENCTLYGEWNKKEIYIKPEPGKELWICLADFSMQGGEVGKGEDAVFKGRIIVDNSVDPADPKTPGTVNFFVPEKGTVNYTDGDSKLVVQTKGNISGDLKLNDATIITSYYANLDGEIDLTKFPIGNLKPEDGGVYWEKVQQIPNIYIYMAGGKAAHENGTAAPVLQSPNDTIITGFICAPYIAFDFNTGRGIKTGARITYDTHEVIEDKISIIGQVIVGDIVNFKNQNILIQISLGEGFDSGTAGYTKWTEVEGASYAYGH